jgi:hypothetical protein
MTIPIWGRVTPSRVSRLQLAGHVLRRNDVEPGTAVSDDVRLRAIRHGRQQRRRLTGQDRGYDLRRWHDLLLSGSRDWAYRHPYAWATVKPASETAITDPDRRRLLTMLEEAGSGATEPAT